MLLDDKRKSYLCDNGWELTFESDTMLKYVKYNDYGFDWLYIHESNDDDGKHYCQLYPDVNLSEEGDSYVFSVLRMVSMLKKLC